MKKVSQLFVPLLFGIIMLQGCKKDKKEETPQPVPQDYNTGFFKHGAISGKVSTKTDAGKSVNFDYNFEYAGQREYIEDGTAYDLEVTRTFYADFSKQE